MIRPGSQGDHNKHASANRNHHRTQVGARKCAARISGKKRNSCSALLPFTVGAEGNKALHGGTLALDLYILRDLALVRTRKSWTYVSATVGSPKSLPKVKNRSPKTPLGRAWEPYEGLLGPS